MCGRFNVVNTPGLQALLDELGVVLDLAEPRFNVAPTEQVALLRTVKGSGEGSAEGSAVSLSQARWWLTPHWAKELSQKYAMFNARCEGLSKSPAFRKPFASQRGVVPMSSFIEWRGSAGNKQPWKISNASEALAVAALWDLWWGKGKDQGSDEPLLSCTLVTTEAAEAFKPWHKRMPVLLDAADRRRWMDNSQTIASDDSLFEPRLREPLHLVPIDRAAGNARNKAESAMQPSGETVILPAD